MRIFRTTVGTILLVHITIQMKMDLINDSDLVFTKEPFLTSSFMWFAKSMSWILSGRNLAAFVNFWNDVLDMFICWDACQMEAIS